jgi:hypothetical protein
LAPTITLLRLVKRIHKHHCAAYADNKLFLTKRKAIVGLSIAICWVKGKAVAVATAKISLQGICAADVS